MEEFAPLRLGIIGTGVMGGHHTRVAAGLPGCRLVGIYDASRARAEEVAGQFGVTATDEMDALCAAADAVIVATPTVTHAAVAAACLRQGCHVLLEKPIAATVPEAEALIAVARSTDRLLMIGHVERFNPAFTALSDLLAAATVFDAELQRLSTAPGRDRTADIIFDLMIHDLDLALAIANSTPTHVAAMGHRVRSDFIDHVSAQLRFANGMTVRLTASAVSQQRVRKGRLFSADALFEVDFASRELWIHRQGSSSIANRDGLYNMIQQVEQILVPNKEPLAAEQEHFLRVIREGRQPATHAEGGLAALRLASSIQQAVNTQLLEFA